VVLERGRDDQTAGGVVVWEVGMEVKPGYGAVLRAGRHVVTM
jgi:hypothetical protein